jgi:hypothetical protein
VADNYYPILQAAADRLAANVAGIPPVAVRWELELFEGDDVPIVIVAGDAEAPFVRKRTFGRKNWWVYPVYAALVVAKNRAANAGLQEYMALAAAIRDELYQVKLPGVSAVFDTKVKQRPISSFAATAGSNYDVTGTVVAYTTDETALG